MPRLISVSIVAAPWRRFSQAARWKGQPPHRTTGVASWSTSHCQLSNWKADTIDRRSTGRESRALTTSRLRSEAVSSRAESSSGTASSAGRSAA